LEDFMPLDPKLKVFMEQACLLKAPGSAPRLPEVLLAEERQKVKQVVLAPENAQESVAHIDNLVISGSASDLPVRIYIPRGKPPFPVFLFFQKSWCQGNLDTHEVMCRRLCGEVGCIVMTVDYRLAPENPFPAAVEDCYCATSWMSVHATEFHGDPERIAVGGESGGANFAAAVAIMSRNRGGPSLKFQLLICPAADFRVTTDSWLHYDGYIILKEEFLIVSDFYVPKEEDRLHPYAAPSLAPDLQKLPPAYIITAECDPLRDGGELYGQRLKEAGVPATVVRYDGMIHIFMHLSSIVPQSDQALSEVICALRTAFAV
jgi:acetyl esterase/lipase